MNGHLNDLARRINTTHREKGFTVVEPSAWDEPRPVSLAASLALIHSEVSEALESVRVGDVEGFEHELADILIRTLGLAEGLGIDIDAIVAWKMQVNESRVFQHGGKRL